jgi:hypothetical protein
MFGCGGSINGSPSSPNARAIAPLRRLEHRIVRKLGSTLSIIVASRAAWVALHKCDALCRTIRLMVAIDVADRVACACGPTDELPFVSRPARGARAGSGKSPRDWSAVSVEAWRRIVVIVTEILPCSALVACQNPSVRCPAERSARSSATRRADIEADTAWRILRRFPIIVETMIHTIITVSNIEP